MNSLDWILQSLLFGCFVFAIYISVAVIASRIRIWRRWPIALAVSGIIGPWLTLSYICAAHYGDFYARSWEILAWKDRERATAPTYEVLTTKGSPRIVEVYTAPSGRTRRLEYPNNLSIFVYFIVLTPIVTVVLFVSWIIVACRVLQRVRSLN